MVGLGLAAATAEAEMGATRAVVDQAEGMVVGGSAVAQELVVREGAQVVAVAAVAREEVAAEAVMAAGATVAATVAVATVVVVRVGVKVTVD